MESQVESSNSPRLGIGGKRSTHSYLARVSSNPLDTASSVLDSITIVVHTSQQNNTIRSGSEEGTHVVEECDEAVATLAHSYNVGRYAHGGNASDTCLSLGLRQVHLRLR